MALSFGRGRHREGSRSGSRGESTSDIVAALQHAGANAFTGMLEVVDHDHGLTARLYLFGGGIYSVRLEGYPGDPRARHLAAGVLASAGDRAMPGATERDMVEQGLLAVDDVGRVHQELLLASAGAVVRAHLGPVSARAGEVTDELCTVPLPVDDVLAAVELRATRQAATWSVVSTGASPSSAVLEAVSGVQAPHAPPELGALLDALDGRRTLDEAAGTLGLTRAEAVHLAATLVAAGAARVRGSSSPGASTTLRVPEEFGTTGLIAQRAFGQPAQGGPTTQPGQGPEHSRERELEQAHEQELEHELLRALDEQNRLAARIADLRMRLDRVRELGRDEVPRA